MEKNKYLEMYRLQSAKINSEYTLTQAPIKRVLVSGVGKIEFNPDDRQYIYFSRTNKHHVYYIFNKVLKIMVNELKARNHMKIYSTLGLPKELSEASFYTNTTSRVINQVKKFFRDYLPPASVEVVTLKYLNEFSKLFESCASSNKSKAGDNIPEITDTQNYGGAYGVNDAWLKLLKTCIVSSYTTSLSFDYFFEFLKENTFRGTTCRKSLKGLLNSNPDFFEMLGDLTYRELDNPEFYDKNNLNRMVSSVQEIYDKELYNPDMLLSHRDISKITRTLKHSMEDEREH